MVVHNSFQSAPLQLKSAVVAWARMSDMTPRQIWERLRLIATGGQAPDLEYRGPDGGFALAAHYSACNGRWSLTRRVMTRLLMTKPPSELILVMTLLYLNLHCGVPFGKPPSQEMSSVTCGCFLCGVCTWEVSSNDRLLECEAGMFLVWRRPG